VAGSVAQPADISEAVSRTPSNADRVFMMFLQK